ncbi:histidinol-phosphatase HisJ family protein [Bacillus horti]|uniref:Histidinol-phosphatase n=1 Tax=Caldalkalibacillus horti TaxID=77523 RepID=A0ABT9W5Q7_9BACI|nr:histidinol-phosphatase HisJ family protein [Bacillus horti]MDQ0168180.1 histidinol-phosphatase (PHP family) [Bacillus horti]
MRTDYHVHMHETGDFSIDWLKKYIEKAKLEGISELGISEHAYFFNETKGILSNPWVDGRRGLPIASYLSMFEQAQKEGLQVKMGIEMDYTPEKENEMQAFIEAYPFDYVIGSIHWIGDWGIDLMEYRSEYERRNILEVYEAYFDQVVTLAESKLFDFIGHIDLVKIFNYRPTDTVFLEQQYDRAVQALAASGTSIEISTAGLRKPVGEIYPDTLLLQKCYDAGVTIVLCSDAHHPDHIGYAYDQSIQLAQSVGYTEVQTFSKRKREAFPLG